MGEYEFVKADEKGWKSVYTPEQLRESKEEQEKKRRELEERDKHSLDLHDFLRRTTWV